MRKPMTEEAKRKLAEGRKKRDESFIGPLELPRNRRRRIERRRHHRNKQREKEKSLKPYIPPPPKPKEEKKVHDEGDPPIGKTYGETYRELMDELQAYRSKPKWEPKRRTG